MPTKKIKQHVRGQTEVCTTSLITLSLEAKERLDAFPLMQAGSTGAICFGLVDDVEELDGWYDSVVGRTRAIVGPPR